MKPSRGIVGQSPRGVELGLRLADQHLRLVQRVHVEKRRKLRAQNRIGGARRAGHPGNRRPSSLPGLPAKGWSGGREGPVDRVLQDTGHRVIVFGGSQRVARRPRAIWALSFSTGGGKPEARGRLRCRAEIEPISAVSIVIAPAASPRSRRATPPCYTSLGANLPQNRQNGNAFRPRSYPSPVQMPSLFPLRQPPIVNVRCRQIASSLGPDPACASARLHLKPS